MDGEGSRDVQETIALVGIEQEDGADLFRVVDPDGIGEKRDVWMRFQIVAEVLAGGEPDGSVDFCGRVHGGLDGR